MVIFNTSLLHMLTWMRDTSSASAPETPCLLFHLQQHRAASVLTVSISLPPKMNCSLFLSSPRLTNISLQKVICPWEALRSPGWADDLSPSIPECSLSSSLFRKSLCRSARQHQSMSYKRSETLNLGLYALGASPMSGIMYGVNT